MRCSRSHCERLVVRC